MADPISIRRLARRLARPWRRVVAWSGPTRLLTIVLVAALLTAAGCGGTGLTRGAVSGQVTLHGQPLPSGRILFTSQAANGGVTVSARIRNGAYQLSQEDGPVIGPQKVEVEIDRQLGFAIDDEQEYAKRHSGVTPAGAGSPTYRVPAEFTTTITDGVNVYNVPLPPQGNGAFFLSPKLP